MDAVRRSAGVDDGDVGRRCGRRAVHQHAGLHPPVVQCPRATVCSQTTGRDGRGNGVVAGGASSRLVCRAGTTSRRGGGRASLPPRRCFERRLRHQAGVDDEPLRRRTDVGEGIARHQRQRRGRCRVEHPHVVGLDDAGALDGVGEGAFRRDQPDDVADLDAPAGGGRTCRGDRPGRCCLRRPVAPCRECARRPVAACVRPRLP